MADYTFRSEAVFDPITDLVMENATGGKLVEEFDGPALPIFDLNDNSISEITSSPSGQSLQFKADVYMGMIQFGSVAVFVVAEEVATFAVNAQGAIATAAEAQATANQAAAGVQALLDAGVALPAGGQLGDYLAWSAPNQGVWADPPTGTGGGVSSWNDLTDKPTTFTPSTHTHTSGQISDATTVGRAVVTAADQASARAAIGAGTGSGTSNLTLGTTATTAAAGNHAHTASSVSFTPTGSLTAATVQDAIVQASNSGGTSSASQVLVWRYTSGAWPALPATKPTGVYELRALGPSYPTSLPSWVGVAANLIPMSYSKVSVL